VSRALAALALVALLGCPPPEPAGPELCASGLDEDGDGDIDCFDSDCAWRVDCRGAVVGPEALESRHLLSIPEGSRFGGGESFIDRDWGGDLDGDGHVDLGFVHRVSEERESADSPGRGGGWVRVAASSQLDGASVDLTDAPVSITSEVGGTLEHGITTRCDVDGDGLDDLVAIDRYFSWYGHPAPDDLALTIAFGSPTLGQDGPLGEAELLSIPLAGLTSISGFDVGVDCGGDIDGDQRDELLVRAGTSNLGQLLYVLDSDLLLEADELADAISIAWVIEALDVEGIGDLDGDGFDDLWLPSHSVNHRELAAGEAWSQGLILPGGPHLAAPREFLSDLFEEARPPVAIDLEVRDGPLAPLSHPPFVRFGDMTNDGIVEVALYQPTLVTELHAHEGLRWLDGPIHLGPESLLAVIGDGYDPDLEGRLRARTFPASITDLDGDGAADLLLVESGLFAAPEHGGPGLTDPDVDGFGVIFGGASDVFRDRSWLEVDVFLVQPALPGSAWLAPDGDRDGDDLPDLAFCSPYWSHVGVIPGWALAEVR
jgi:hypothetical protein